MNFSEKINGGLLEKADPLFMKVDLDALKYNFEQLQSIIGPQKIIPSIKGNGYGIGADAVSKVFKECGAYAVATGSIHEAIAIRNSGNDIPVHLFAGILPSAMPLVRQLDLIPTIYNRDLALAASEVAGEEFKVFIKVDAGFGRLGVPLEEAFEFIAYVSSLPGLKVEGVFTHVPFIDDLGLHWAMSCLKNFDELLKRLENSGFHIPVTQSLASSGVLKNIPTHTNTVCVGHLLYGGLGRQPVNPEKTALFKPVITEVSTQIIHFRSYSKNTIFGSGGNYNIESGSTIGVVPIGLHEGYRSPQKNKQGFMLCKGKRVPVIFVSQEYTAINLTGVEDIKIGDTVTVLGNSCQEVITIEEMASWQGQTPLHVVMNMTERMEVKY